MEYKLAQRLDAVDVGTSDFDDWSTVVSTSDFWLWFHNLVEDFHDAGTDPESLELAACPSNDTANATDTSAETQLACRLVSEVDVPESFPTDCLSFLSGYIDSGGLTGSETENSDLGSGVGGYLDPHTRIVSGIVLSVESMAKTTCPNDRFDDISRTCFSGVDREPFFGDVSNVEYIFSDYSQAYTRLFDMGMYATASESVTCEARTLEVDGYIRDGASIVSVFIPTYNAGLDLFAVAKIIFYPSGDGHLRPWREFRSVPLRGTYSTTSGLLHLLVEIPILIMLTVYTGIEVRKIIKRPRRYFMSAWSLIEGGFCVVNWAVILQWILFAVSTSSNPLDVPKELRSADAWAQAYDNVDTIVELADTFEQYKVSVALLMMAILLKTFRFLSLNRRLDLVAATLSAAARDLAHFAVVLVIIVCIYAFAGVVVFGHISPSYRSFGWAAHSLMRAAWLDMDFEELWEAQPVAAVPFFYSYVALVSILLFNVLLSLTVDTFIRVQSKWGDAESAVETILQYGGALRKSRSRGSHTTMYQIPSVPSSAAGPAVAPKGPPTQAKAEG